MNDRTARSVQNRALTLFQPIEADSVGYHHQTVLKLINPEAATSSLLSEKHVIRRPSACTEDDAAIVGFVRRMGTSYKDNWLVLLIFLSL